MAFVWKFHCGLAHSALCFRGRLGGHLSKWLDRWSQSWWSQREWLHPAYSSFLPRVTNHLHATEISICAIQVKLKPVKALPNGLQRWFLCLMFISHWYISCAITVSQFSFSLFFYARLKCWNLLFLKKKCQIILSSLLWNSILVSGESVAMPLWHHRHRVSVSTVHHFSFFVSASPLHVLIWSKV